VKTPSELDHYELLALERDATPEQIERAYRQAAATWSQGSLATYSLFDEAEVMALRERVELAWSVLADAEARAAYERSLGAAADAAADDLGLDLDLVFEDPAPRPALIPAIADFEEALEDEGGGWDGARLRRRRLERGIDLDQIARATKVNPTYLRFIEEENREGLPAAVYVRGFVSAYARCLGLDGPGVAADYVERFEAARRSQAAQLASAHRGRR
jgi:flagellar biosynthesis protein FlhG